MTITEFILFMHPLWVLRLLFAALLVRGCKHCLNAAAAVKKKTPSGASITAWKMAQDNRSGATIGALAGLRHSP